MQQKAVFLDVGSLGDDIDLAPLKKLPLDWVFYHQTLPAERVARIQDAAVIVTNKVLLDAEVLRQASCLQLVCVAATGINNIDVATARQCGISVQNVTDYATPSVVQHVFMILLALAGRLLPVQAAIQQRQWQQSPFFSMLDFPFAELQEKTLGIIGYGVLGQAVAKTAKGFGMQVQVVNIPGRPEKKWRLPLVELLSCADVVTLHCPLTGLTRNLIDENALKRMKPTALLINTARGGIVDEAALLRALHQGRLAGAGVDVLCTEPPTECSSPLLSVELPNLIVTPHIAWASRESRQRLLVKVADNIHNFMDTGFQ